MRSVWLMAGWLLAGCVSDVADDATFYCETDGECLRGWSCVANRCDPGPRLDMRPADMAVDMQPDLPILDMQPDMAVDMQPDLPIPDMDPPDRAVDGGVDTDADGVADATDNCPAVPNANQADLDADGVGDACDPDRDGDTWADIDEITCGSDLADPLSRPDDAERDPDADAVCSALDNCPEKENPDQRDRDTDGLGDACDPDLDGDTVLNEVEIDCESDPESPQSVPVDLDGDGTCDPLDDDDDGDGVDDEPDNCPRLPNPGQQDRDGDTIGDHCAVCAVDDDCFVVVGAPVCDGGAVCGQRSIIPAILGACVEQTCVVDDALPPVELLDNCTAEEICSVAAAAPGCQPDAALCPDGDSDGIGAAIDNCPDVFNPRQVDADLNGIGDACDDRDEDGFVDAVDQCPRVPSPINTADFCALCENVGDPCFVSTGATVCATAGCNGVLATPGYVGTCDGARCGLWDFAQREKLEPCGVGAACGENADGDLTCEPSEVCANDFDGDGVPDNADNCAQWFNPDQADDDGNGIGDRCDFPCDADADCPGASEPMTCGPDRPACGGTLVLAAFDQTCVGGQCTYVPQESRCDSGQRCDNDTLACEFVPDCWPDRVDDCADELDGVACFAAQDDPLAPLQGRCIEGVCKPWVCIDLDCNDLGPRDFSTAPLAYEAIVNGGYVEDGRTRLQWYPRILLAESLADAHTVCGAINDAQFRWRLPTIWELLAVLPADDAERRAFSNTFGPLPSSLLSRTLRTNNAALLAVLGEATPGVASTLLDARRDVLCVREPLPATRDPGARRAAALVEGRYVDPWTGLTWTQSDPTPATRAEAVLACGGVNGELPSVRAVNALMTWQDLARPGWWPTWDGLAFAGLEGAVWTADPFDAERSWLVQRDGTTAVDQLDVGTICVIRDPEGPVEPGMQ